MSQIDSDDISDLPASVLKEVADAKREGAPEEEPAEDRSTTVTLSRRDAAKKAKEELETRIKAAEERAARLEEAAERRGREQTEQLTRMQMILEQQAQARAPQRSSETDQQEYIDPRLVKARKEAFEALAKGEMDEYQDRQERIADIKAENRVNEALRRMPRPEAPQQQVPDFVRVVESQHPDVLLHGRGKTVVAGFLNMDAEVPATQEQATAKLQRAFNRARAELGLDKAKSSSNAQARALYGGVGPSRSVARGPSTGEKRVTLSETDKAMAKKFKMSLAEYAALRAADHPEDVETD